LGFTAILSSSIYLHFFACYPRRSGHMLRNKCDLKTHVQNLGYPFPLQIGGPKTHIFPGLYNLIATAKGYIFGTKHEVDNRASMLASRRGMLHLKTM